MATYMLVLVDVLVVAEVEGAAAGGVEYDGMGRDMGGEASTKGV
jgi:hypothetical protein